jgi:hypothetical protein
MWKEGSTAAKATEMCMMSRGIAYKLFHVFNAGDGIVLTKSH